MKKGLPVFLFFAVMSLIITYPAIFHLSDKLIGDGGDNYQSFAYQYIASSKIRQWQYPFNHTDIFRYPVGFHFEKGHDSVISILIGSGLSLVLNNISAYNLTVLALFVINGLLSYLLFNYLSKSNLIGCIGAFIYGYSSYVIARSAGHLNLMLIGGFPFFIYSVLRIKSSGWNIKNTILFYLSITVVIFSSYQYGLVLIGSIMLNLPLVLIFLNEENWQNLQKYPSGKKPVLAISFIFLIIILFFSYPFITALITEEFVRVDRSALYADFSPDLKDFIIPNNYLPLLITHLFKNLNNSFKSIERSVFVGWLEIGLFIVYIIFKRQNRIKKYLICSTIVFFILSLGFINKNTGWIMPYYYINRIIPFSFIPEAGRFFIIFNLIVSIGITLLLSDLLRLKKTYLSYILMIIIAVALISERLPKNYWLSPVFSDKEYVQRVKKQPGGAVLDLPLSYYNTTYDILPYAYGKKIVNGNFQWFAHTEKTKSFIRETGLEKFACGYNSPINLIETSNNKLIKQLVQANIRTIVIHKNDLEDKAKYYFPQCADARLQTSILLPQLYSADPTEKQKILPLFFPAIPGIGDTVTFDYEGIFYLDGIHAYPSDQLPLEISIDNQPLALEQNWKNRDNNNVTLDPFLQIPVKKGSKITFKFSKKHNQGYSFIKLWYQYQVNELKKDDNFGQIIKVYEDDDAAVFQIK